MYLCHCRRYIQLFFGLFFLSFLQQLLDSIANNVRINRPKTNKKNETREI